MLNRAMGGKWLKCGSSGVLLLAVFVSGMAFSDATKKKHAFLFGNVPVYLGMGEEEAMKALGAQFRLSGMEPTPGAAEGYDICEERENSAFSIGSIYFRSGKVICLSRDFLHTRENQQLIELFQKLGDAIDSCAPGGGKAQVSLRRSSNGDNSELSLNFDGREVNWVYANSDGGSQGMHISTKTGQW